jgi:hypothetical protein
MTTAESLRMATPGPWRLWGPYLSDRQWGTVREDYSANGDAWRYFPHDHARSRAYRWGEDGLLGVSDDQQRLCVSLCLWNGRDAILKERLFGLANEEGNHGEDVKELYYHLDATPSHSYLKGLYKYPQRPFPYARLYDENRRRGRGEPEFELLDAGLFSDDRYFDVFVEYAKSSPTDFSMRITAHNRGPDSADLHLLPTVWFRNTWSWVADAVIPELKLTNGSVTATHPTLGTYHITADANANWLFCENETNAQRLFNAPGPQYPKDAFHEYVVKGKTSAVNPAKVGTKAAAYSKFTLAPGTSCTMTLSFSQNPGTTVPGDVFTDRKNEADEFYGDLQYKMTGDDRKLVQRQAFAGLIWTKQFYQFDVATWLDGDPTQPAPPPGRREIRNADWAHLSNADVVSMPDKWEYPWYAAWDLAFHMIPFARIDPDFAKNQLLLFTREWYAHPNGQLPAYEWNFGDVNPPVHAWACWRVFQIDRKARRSAARHLGRAYDEKGDLGFLERVFHKLMINFTWWVNKKDAAGRNIFQGGFLGMDNVGVFDRSKPLPTGGHIDQSDGTAWMAMYALTLMRMALELARTNPAYQDVAAKFFEHFLMIAAAMADFGDTGHGLWDEEDGFYYDELNLPDGQRVPLKVRSMVGLVPMFAVETLDPALLDQVPDFKARLDTLLASKPQLASLISRWAVPGAGDRKLLSLLRGSRMKKLLKRMLDETEFLSPYGIRSLSKAHETAPYTFRVFNDLYSVRYVPGESDTGMFGGNSNWRGPIWFPMNYLLVESLQKFHHYYGSDFRVECPTGSGKMMTIEQVAEELSRRLSRLFLRDPAGHRPAFGPNGKLQTDPHFKDCLLFHEYFHGDTGEGLGAAHQCGWTALVAKLLQTRAPDAPGG